MSVTPKNKDLWTGRIFTTNPWISIGSNVGNPGSHKQSPWLWLGTVNIAPIKMMILGCILGFTTSFFSGPIGRSWPSGAGIRKCCQRFFISWSGSWRGRGGNLTFCFGMKTGSWRIAGSVEPSNRVIIRYPVVFSGYTRWTTETLVPRTIWLRCLLHSWDTVLTSRGAQHDLQIQLLWQQHPPAYPSFTSDDWPDSCLWIAKYLHEGQALVNVLFWGF